MEHEGSNILFGLLTLMEKTDKDKIERRQSWIRVTDRLTLTGQLRTIYLLIHPHPCISSLGLLTTI